MPILGSGSEVETTGMNQGEIVFDSKHQKGSLESCFWLQGVAKCWRVGLSCCCLQPSTELALQGLGLGAGIPHQKCGGDKAFLSMPVGCGSEQNEGLQSAAPSCCR